MINCEDTLLTYLWLRAFPYVDCSLGTKEREREPDPLKKRQIFPHKKCIFTNFHIEFQIDDENNLSSASFLNCQGFPEIKGKLNIKD